MSSEAVVNTEGDFGFFRWNTNILDTDRSTVNAADSHLAEISSLFETDSGRGNVLAIIKFPGDFERGRSCDGKRWQTMSIRMSYDKLMALGSSKITEMFDPKRQARTRRRNNFATLPPGIEYVLDFTPPTEGAELADLTAALWLPRMMKLWFLAGQYLPETIIGSGPAPTVYNKRPLGDKAVGATMVLGHDDVCKSESCLVDLTTWQVKSSVPGIVDEDTYNDAQKHIPAFRRVEDYCPIRHRVAIMRVLRAIEGHDLLLNSAPRLWTVARVAIHLEVPRVVVDPVTQWLIAPPNTKFIEICPERAFQLAYSLKIPSVLIAAFKILVNEVAIDAAALDASPRRPPLTWAQRKRDDYGDFPSDPIEYASRLFSERMAGYVDMLKSETVFDLLSVKIPQWTKLQHLGPLISISDGIQQSELQIAHEKLVRGLVAVFHRKVAEAFEAGYPEGHGSTLIEAQRMHYIPDRERTPLSHIYKSRLNDWQKALTPFFWGKLKQLAIDKDNIIGLQESTFQGKQLWRLVSNFNDLLKREAQSHHIDIGQATTERWGNDINYDAAADFSLNEFSEQMRYSVQNLCTTALDRGMHDNSVPFFLSEHLLLSLNERELDFLPIWAGGLDDGSGGVFQEPIPPTDMGPSEPGPAYHTGHTVGTGTNTATMTDQTSTVAPSDLGIAELAIYSDDGTVARSMDAEQSVTTTGGLARSRRIVASGSTVLSEQFSDADADDEYADAMFAHPAAHQAKGRALAHYAEAPSEDGTGGTLGRSDDEGDYDMAQSEVVSKADKSSRGADGDDGGEELDGFGLVGVESDMDLDDFDDGTSTVDGWSEFDLI
ncbi:hypothetical protein B0T25DRAFT_199371 [Lasiosphaeria hispida]|uniref:Uncharacterized protein n=1 Tax=Lasiosphaeria hispida TaxID=260671 RepID=A0AAJ0HHY1_9PEZI|nr:hypothetical protein B0T25DRAFT_199371 [Lasiosphaeria hispida]